ncbi:calpain-like cysteine peptidase [Leishmania donovani]|uniref:Calpain-like_cysteine_peptidase_putative/GeneDB:L mjF.34.0280 n=1 Tax=Leishmania donovani TaxID=5661 RepID=A0A6J8FMT4_LEIDO|nr:calpain-like cysteine peptidase [Leishmania donovani]VDZ48197.1 calpain-like_cysteine_peptidase_putative/GeneDB:LmjF.34.0280 [Leishmania donovani]
MASVGEFGFEHKILPSLPSAISGRPGYVISPSDLADGRRHSSNAEEILNDAAGQPASRARQMKGSKNARHAPEHTNSGDDLIMATEGGAHARIDSTGGLRALSSAMSGDDSEHKLELNVLGATGGDVHRSRPGCEEDDVVTKPPVSRREGLLPPVRQCPSGACENGSSGADKTAKRTAGTSTRPKGSVQEYVRKKLQLQSERGIRTCSRVRRPLCSILVKSDASESKGGEDANDTQRCDAEPRCGLDSDKSTNNRAFWKRTMSKQETDADLRCYTAHEYILAFYYHESKECDDSLELATPDSSQRRQRERVARVVAEATPREEAERLKLKSRGSISPSTRRAKMTCATVEELYEQLMVCYRKAGVEKGYLDTLFMKEVLSGRRQPRVHEMEKDDDLGENLSAPSDDEVAEVPREVVQVGRPKRSKPVAISKRSAESPSLYEIMLEQMRAKTTPAFLHHNAIPLPTMRFLQNRGTIKLGDYSYVLHLWDDEEKGYLVTGVFDRKPGFPKQFKDSCTYAIYSLEMGRDWGMRFGELVLMRQHLAPGARKHFPEEGKLIRGHTVIRAASVLDIFDGRVCGIPSNLRELDYRRTGIHASVQALAHYNHLFPRWSPLRSIVHPQDIFGCPVVNPTGGIYCLSMIVNGATRMVKVDDRVPVEPESGLFRCLTSATFELYPALLEKGLLKANGCGINLALMESAAVLFQLCGWIPEVIRFRSAGEVEEPTVDGLMRPSEMWSVLMEGYNFGRLMMTLTAHWCAGRPPLTASERVMQSAQWFVTPVVYPVIDMITQRLSTTGEPTIRAIMLRDTTKDPSTRKFEPPFKTSLTAEQLLDLGYMNAHREAGVFCVTWEEALAHFDHCSINWSPFTYWDLPSGSETPEDCTRLCCHGIYDMHNAGKHMARQPQFHICSHLVDRCTHLFLVFCPHAGDQSPLPHDNNMLDKKTVDELSGGGAVVRLRVYEVTTLPSLTQCKMRDSRGRRVTCCFGDCQGRRIVSETEGPRGLQSLAMAQGNRNEFITLGFDCLPGTREYVVVMDVHDRHRPPRGKGTFPYTLTLFTCLDPLLERNPNKLPMFAIHAHHATLEQAKQAAMGGGFSHLDVASADLNVNDLIEEEAQRKPPRQTITIHAIPEHPNIHSRTVQGLWSVPESRTRTVLLPHDATLEVLYTGTQYYFHLDKPSYFALRICQSMQAGPALSTVKMKVLLVRRTGRDDMCTKEKDPPAERKTQTGGGAAGKGGKAYVPRSVQGIVMKGSDVVLSSGAWSVDGAVIDSVSPHTVLLDRNGVLVQNPRRLRQYYHTSFNIALSDRENKDKTNMSFFLMSHPDPSDQMRSVILQAFADGFLISPHACNIGIKGNLIPHDTEVRAVLTSSNFSYELHGDEGHSVPFTQESAQRSLAAPVPQLDLFIDVDLQNTAPAKSTSFSPGSSASYAVDRLRAVVRSALTSSPAQRLRLLRTLFSTMTFVRHTVKNESHRAFLMGLGGSIEAWVRWHQSLESPGVQAPVLSLPPLPEGDYIIIPCFKPLSDEKATELGKKRGVVTGNQGALAFDITLSVPGRVVELIPTRNPADGQGSTQAVQTQMHCEQTIASAERLCPDVHSRRYGVTSSLSRWISGSRKGA